MAGDAPDLFDDHAHGLRFDYRASQKHRYFFCWLHSTLWQDRQDWTYQTIHGLEANGPSSQGFFTSPTIRVRQLLRPFPHLGTLNGQQAPVGGVPMDAVELSFGRCFRDCARCFTPCNGCPGGRRSSERV